MTISQTTFLSKPVEGTTIPPETLGYMRARAKRKAYDLVIRELKKAGITKAELARRLGKGPDRVSKMLGGPANWTIATVSDLLFAICAAEPRWELNFPLDKARRNDTYPHWLSDPTNRIIEAAATISEGNSSPTIVQSLFGVQSETTTPKETAPLILQAFK